MVPEAFALLAPTIAWTPDSSALLVLKQTVDPATLRQTVEAHAELWRVPVTGGQARKLDIDVDAWRRGGLGNYDVGFSLSPDGRQLAFLTGKQGYEVWALENILPAQTANKQTAKK